MNTLKCSLAILFAGATLLEAEPPAIVADTEWKDTSGREILAQAGAVLQTEEKFYWYGVAYDGGKPRQVRCYSSPDLANWSFEGAALPETTSRGVKALYLRDARQFVLFTRTGKEGEVFVSQAAAGPFVRKSKIELPGATGEGDLACFADDGGTVCIAYTSGKSDPAGKQETIIASLGTDLAKVDRVLWKFSEAVNETPSLWKQGELYYCTSSEAGGWHACPTQYSTAPALEGPWTPWKRIGKSISGSLMLNVSYNSKHNTVFQIKGAQGVLSVYWGDRWSQFTQYGVGTQVWLPLEFEGEAPVLTWYRPWFPDVAQGTFGHDLRRYGLWRGR